MAKKRRSTPPRAVTRTKKGRAVDDRFGEFLKEVEKRPHWPEVRMGECQEIYLAAFGSSFKRGDYSYDKIRKLLEKARSRWRDSESPGK